MSRLADLIIIIAHKYNVRINVILRWAYHNQNKRIWSNQGFVCSAICKSDRSMPVCKCMIDSKNRGDFNEPPKYCCNHKEITQYIPSKYKWEGRK